MGPLTRRGFVSRLCVSFVGEFHTRSLGSLGNNGFAIPRILDPRQRLENHRFHSSKVEWSQSHAPMGVSRIATNSNQAKLPR